MRLRLLILDVEGVLTAPGGSQYPWSLEALLQIRDLLAAAPVACVLCTGRQVPYGEAVIQALNLYCPLDSAAAAYARGVGAVLEAWPSILENGAYFFDPLAKRPIPHPALRGEQDTRLRALRDGALARLVQQTGAVLEAGKDFTVSLNPPPVRPGARERRTPAEWLPEVRAALGNDAGQMEIKASASAVDVAPPGISKAAAVRLLQGWTGLAPQEVAGVGDTAADADWLDEVGWRAAPANGRTALAGLDFYSDGNDAIGLVQILRSLADRGWCVP